MSRGAKGGQFSGRNVTTRAQPPTCGSRRRARRPPSWPPPPGPSKDSTARARPDDEPRTLAGRGRFGRRPIARRISGARGSSPPRAAAARRRSASPPLVRLELQMVGARARIYRRERPSVQPTHAVATNCQPTRSVPCARPRVPGACPARANLVGTFPVGRDPHGSRRALRCPCHASRNARTTGPSPCWRAPRPTTPLVAGQHAICRAHALRARPRHPDLGPRGPRCKCARMRASAARLAGLMLPRVAALVRPDGPAVISGG